MSEVVRDDAPAHAYRLVGNLAMKGKAEPVRVHEVMPPQR